jgi:tRNA U34 2-thiouridine synthase MnmA/TrmU
VPQPVRAQQLQHEVRPRCSCRPPPCRPCEGYAGFTVGERKGLGNGFAEPMHVLEVRADTDTREVVVGPPRRSSPMASRWTASTGCRTRRRPARRCQCSSATAPRRSLHPWWSHPFRTTCCGWLRGAQRAVTPGQSAVSSSESECSVEGGSCERSGFSEQPAEPLCVDFAPSAIFLSTHERPQH